MCIVQIRLLQLSSHGHSQLPTDAESPKYCCTPHSQSTTPSKLPPLLQQLHWLPISERIKYKTACMYYNAITGSAPSYLSELLHLYSPSRSLRSSLDTRMLKLQCFNRKTHGIRTFSPHTLDPTSGTIFPKRSGTLLLSSFKSKLKTFLFSCCFS